MRMVLVTWDDPEAGICRLIMLKDRNETGELFLIERFNPAQQAWYGVPANEDKYLLEQALRELVERLL